MSLPNTTTVHSYTTWTPAKYTIRDPEKSPITSGTYDITTWTRANYTITPLSLLDALPSELQGRVLALAGNSPHQTMLCKNEDHRESNRASLGETIEGYMASPTLSPLVSEIRTQQGFSPHKLAPHQCLIIIDLIRQAILNRARNVNIFVEDPSNVHLSTLLERVKVKEKEKENRHLIILFNRLRNQIPAAPTFEAMPLEERANNIRLWMRENPERLNTITELNLSHLNLEILPPEIGLLTALQRLDLSNNQLHALPPEIGQLTALQELDLSNNRLHALPPEIRLLTALQALFLHNNQLRTLPPEIRLLTALQTLFL